MAYQKRPGLFSFCAFSYPCDNRDVSLQRGFSYISLHLVPLFLLLSFLYGTLFLALPIRLAFSVSRWRTVEEFWMHRSALWSSPSIISRKSQMTTSGVIQTTEELPEASGFQRINLLNVNLANPNVRLGIVQEHDQLVGPGETLSSMAQRTGAVAGINGDFFEIKGTGDELGMLEIDGQIWQSPGSFAVLGITSSGRMTLGPEAFSGSVIAGGTSYPLHSINRYGDAGTNRLALFTPALGAALSLNNATVALLQPVPGSDRVFTVGAVQAGVASLPVLLHQDALVGGGSAGSWLSSSLHPGETVTLREQILPDSNLVQAIGGGPILIKDGMAYQDPSSPVGQDDAHNPLTAVGVTRDGTHLLMVVSDGHQADPNLSQGFTRAEMTAYLLAHGAYQAMSFDSGGSSEMVARLPGQSHVSVINSPSDGNERLVANGLFLYSRERRPGPATSVVINEGNPLVLLTGTTVPISAYALDALANPAANPVHISAFPGGLTRVVGNAITAAPKAGQGQIVAQAGRARDFVTLRVVDHLATLRLAPSASDLANGQHVQFQAAATAAGEIPVPLPTNAVRWSVDPPSLGSIDSTGLFTASPSVSGVGSVTATAGGVSASVKIVVGQVAQPANLLTNAPPDSC